ncbi:hypothetical protein VTL71DRAFT_13895 [Oculimacula yallundae]|uniref:Uncharacterized protein n=1 Tax=Oculimacula yallundae TaxID=86028 RepID=A0ABR4CLQ4_9HELO
MTSGSETKTSKTPSGALKIRSSMIKGGSFKNERIASKARHRKFRERPGWSEMDEQFEEGGCECSSENADCEELRDDDEEAMDRRLDILIVL